MVAPVIVVLDEARDLGFEIVRLQMLLDNVGGVGTEALARLGLEFKRLSSDVAIVAA